LGNLKLGPLSNTDKLNWEQNDIKEFKMNTDEISKIIIDSNGKIRIYPVKNKFTMIYRSAAEVHWDPNDNALHSPKPREWNYCDWFSHILSVVRDEYGIKLLITNATAWENIDVSLKNDIVAKYSEL